MILFMTKIKKFGMITILCTISGLLTFSGGYGWMCIAGAVICGLLSDIILKVGKYESWKHMLLSYIIFNEWAVSTMLPMFILKEAYLEPYRTSQGDDYVNSVLQLINYWMIPVVIICIAVASIIGAYLGRAILKKHFKRAGIV